MKKLLLGSTALVAAGLMAGEAFAADGVKLGIGGRYMGAAGINAIQDFEDFDNTFDHPRSYAFKQDVEVYFLGETTLDNGLTVGARVELEGQTQAGDQIDAVFAYFSGGFGELRFGDTSEAYAQFCYLVPSASGIFGADSPNFNFSNNGLVGYGATNGTCYGMDDKSTKIVYFSPNFAGFSFAASFTPDDTEDTRNTLAGAGTRNDNDVGQNSENVSVAANYTGDFGTVNVIVGGGGTWSFDAENDGTPATNRDEATAYNAYARLGFAGFTFGGAMEIRNDFAPGGDDNFVYGAGATYNWDAWTVGLGWTHGEYETNFAPVASDLVEEHDIFSLTGSYALGPGIQLDGVVEYDVSEDELNDKYEGLAIGIGTLISF